MTIGCPPDVVWATVSDYSTDSVWRPDITEMTPDTLALLPLAHVSARCSERRSRLRDRLDGHGSRPRHLVSLLRVWDYWQGRGRTGSRRVRVVLRSRLHVSSHTHADWGHTASQADGRRITTKRAAEGPSSAFGKSSKAASSADSCEVGNPPVAERVARRRAGASDTLMTTRRDALVDLYRLVVTDFSISVRAFVCADKRHVSFRLGRERYRMS